MAMKFRRRFRSRSFAGKKGGRSYFWIRDSPFSVSLQEASTATHADILLTESDWQNPTTGLNTTQRGGPRLERLIIDYGLSTVSANNWFLPAGEANIASIPEFMVWRQSDQFAVVVVSSATFNATRSSHRVIMDEIPNMETMSGIGAANSTIRTVRGRFETKVKVRLADSSLGIAWRGRFDTGAANLTGYTDWVRPTMLVSVP